MPVSSRTSRCAAASSVSPDSGWPLGRASVRRPSGPGLRGTIATISSPRTTTPPAETSRLEDIPLQRARVVHGQLAAALRDDPRALERGQEARGRLAGGAGELGDLRLCGGDQDVGVGGALALGVADELRQDGRDAALHGLEGLAGEAVV